MTHPFRYFNNSPEVIRLLVMMYVRYPLSAQHRRSPGRARDRHQPLDCIGGVVRSCRVERWLASWRVALRVGESRYFDDAARRLAQFVYAEMEMIATLGAPASLTTDLRPNQQSYQLLRWRSRLAPQRVAGRIEVLPGYLQAF
jgi:hypothetical protein